MTIHKGLGLVLLGACLALAGACGDDDDDDGTGGSGGAGGTGGSGGSGGSGGTGGTGGSGATGGTGGSGGSGGEGGTGGGGGSGGTEEFILVIDAGAAYVPERLTVPPGATVTVRNEDDMAHTVTSGNCVGTTCTPETFDGVTIDTGSIAAGAEGSFLIPVTATSGTEVPYFCEFHPGAGNPPATMANLGVIVIE